MAKYVTYCPKCGCEMSFGSELTYRDMGSAEQAKCKQCGVGWWIKLTGRHINFEIDPVSVKEFLKRVL